MRALPDQTKIDVMQWERNDMVPGCITFVHPNPMHKMFWDEHGFVETNDHAADVLDWYGLCVTAEVDVPTQIIVTLTCSLCRNPRQEALPQVSANVVVNPNETTYVPFEQFSFDKGMNVLLKGVVAVSIIADGDGSSSIRSLSFVAARDLLIGCKNRGKAFHADDSNATVSYDIELVNVLDKSQKVSAVVERHGGEILNSELSESMVELKPGEHHVVHLTVQLNARLAQFGYERQNVIFTTTSGNCQSVVFYTVRGSDDYRTTITREDIKQIKKKISTYEWAKNAYEDRYKQAELWQVPTVDVSKDYLFQTRNSDMAYNCALIALISGERRFAEKSATFLREIVSPEGYFRTLKGGSQELVHEGEFFKFVAFTYDHIRDMHLLDDHEENLLHDSFRIFIEIVRCEMMKGKLSNWQLCELQGAIECAAEMQDLERIDYFLHCDGGIFDHLSRGILDDGWWCEAAIGYNYLAMGTFLQLITTVDKWGFNLRDAQVPASYGRFSTFDDTMLPERDRIDGLTTEIWSSFERNTHSVKQLVDSMTPFFGSDGVIFGMNDSCEDCVPAYQLMDPRYDLAYRIYRDPTLLLLLSTVPDNKRDLWYGVDELPPVNSKTLNVFSKSVHADVAGITMLRSQKRDCDLDSQYQVTIKTGILGGAHGHYDRLALNSIRRYGKSFYNPENVWYSYHTFMYKFYVQNSIAHNMTLVDLKQQDPNESRILQFRSDPNIQVVVHEIITRWCNPPYGGWVITPGISFAEQAWREGRSVTLPSSKERPNYASRSGYTEPVIQRRATLVTDDYVVLIDYLEGRVEHQYDVTMHVNGLRSISGEHGGEPVYLCDDPQDRDHFNYSRGTNDLTYLGVEDKLDDSPLSSGQFITNCHIFNANGIVKTTFAVDMSKFNGGKWMTNTRSNFNAAGNMIMDVYSVAPKRRQIIIGCDPEYYQIQQKLHYAIFADLPGRVSFMKPKSGETISNAVSHTRVHEGDAVIVVVDDIDDLDRYVGQQPLTSGKFGAWIFGRDDIDVIIPKGTKSIVLTTVSDESFIAEENEHWPPVPALFWGNGVIECADGTRLLLRELPYKLENTVPVPVGDRDYNSGPVKLEMKRMSTSIPATSANANFPACVRVDLSSLVRHGALRLKVSVGADYPIGDERDCRRTLDIRAQGRSANFVTVIEQHDGAPMIRSIQKCDNAVLVTLADGRMQCITISDMTLANAEIKLKDINN